MPIPQIAAGPSEKLPQFAKTGPKDLDLIKNYEPTHKVHFQALK